MELTTGLLVDGYSSAVEGWVLGYQGAPSPAGELLGDFKGFGVVTKNKLRTFIVLESFGRLNDVAE